MKKKTLKQVRESIGLTQEQIAGKLGITMACWNYKENYKRVLKADELIKLSELANIDPREIKLHA